MALFVFLGGELVLAPVELAAAAALGWRQITFCKRWDFWRCAASSSAAGVAMPLLAPIFGDG